MSSLRKSRIIQKISYLKGDTREVVTATQKGTFRMQVKETVEGRVKHTYKDLTAREVIYHSLVKDNDPVLTLTSGEKIRVYPGGDSSYLPAMVDGMLSKHDRTETLRRKMKMNKKKNEKKREQVDAALDEFATYMPWWGDEEDD